MGEFGGLRPLVSEMFSGTGDALANLHNYYEHWRRDIAADKPVLQEQDGKSDDRYKEGLRDEYSTLVRILRWRI